MYTIIYMKYTINYIIINIFDMSLISSLKNYGCKQENC